MSATRKAEATRWEYGVRIVGNRDGAFVHPDKASADAMVERQNKVGQIKWEVVKRRPAGKWQ